LELRQQHRCLNALSNLIVQVAHREADILNFRLRRYESNLQKGNSAMFHSRSDRIPSEKNQFLTDGNGRLPLPEGYECAERESVTDEDGTVIYGLRFQLLSGSGT
jgi:hypothetical protein